MTGEKHPRAASGESFVALTFDKNLYVYSLVAIIACTVSLQLRFHILKKGPKWTLDFWRWNKELRGGSLP